MSKESSSSSSGIGFCGLLTIVFITLKLLNKIDWSWWWVLSPLLISVAIWVIVVVGFIFYTAFNSRSKKRKYNELVDKYKINESFDSNSHKSKFMKRLDEAMAAQKQRENNN